LKRFNRIPVPYILEPPTGKKRDFSVGEEIRFDLVLVGDAIRYFPHMVFVFRELGEVGLGKSRGRCFLKRVIQTGEEGGRDRVLYEGARGTFPFALRPVNASELWKSLPRLSPDELMLCIETPLRILDRPCRQVEFHHLVRNLLRRVSSLLYFHQRKILEYDFRGAVERAGAVRTLPGRRRDLSWYDWERFSGRQKKRIKMGGVVGEIAFRGDLEEFLPLFLLGEAVHVGKHVSLGMGKYRIMQ